MGQVVGDLAEGRLSKNHSGTFLRLRSATKLSCPTPCKRCTNLRAGTPGLLSPSSPSSASYPLRQQLALQRQPCRVANYLHLPVTMTAATAAVVVVAVAAVVVGTPHGCGSWVGQVVGNLAEGRLSKHPSGTSLRLRSATKLSCPTPCKRCANLRAGTPGLLSPSSPSSSSYPLRQQLALQHHPLRK